MNKKNPAFTLVELIIAITVFSIFVAFGMTGFSVFHRVQQDSATSRDLMFQIDDAMNLITEAVKENKIDYDYYACVQDTKPILDPAELTASIKAAIRSSSCGVDSINPNSLVLISTDGNKRIIFTWDISEQTLNMQKFNKDEISGDFVEDGDFLKLQSDSAKVTEASFRIFPKSDPYNDGSDYYQPNVKIKMTFETPGQAKPTISLDFQTTITSRVYQ